MSPFDKLRANGFRIIFIVHDAEEFRTSVDGAPGTLSFILYP